MKRLIALSTIALACTAHAVVFVNPSLAIYPPPGPVVLGPQVASLSSSVVDDMGHFAATLTSSVHTGGNNPLGGLTFVYRVSNDLLPPTSGNDLYAFGVLWDPNWVPAVIDLDTAPPVAGLAPFSFVFGPNGIAWSFNFASLPVGSSSVAVAVGTAAPSWSSSDGGIFNGTTEDARVLVPVPEPFMYAGLFALGLAGFAVWRRLRA